MQKGVGSVGQGVQIPYRTYEAGLDLKQEEKGEGRKMEGKKLNQVRAGWAFKPFNWFYTEPAAKMKQEITFLLAANFGTSKHSQTEQVPFVHEREFLAEKWPWGPNGGNPGRPGLTCRPVVPRVYTGTSNHSTQICGDRGVQLGASGSCHPMASGQVKSGDSQYRWQNR